MLDTLAILSTCAMLVLVAFRAIRLDRAEPWFPTVRPPDAGGDSEPRTRGRFRRRS